MISDMRNPATTRINNKTIKHNLVNEKDYKTVKKEVWDKFSKIYGGGPAIVREKPYIYSADVEEMKSPITLNRLKSSSPRHKAASVISFSNTNPSIMIPKVKDSQDGEKKNIFGKKDRQRAGTGAQKKDSDLPN